MKQYLHKLEKCDERGRYIRDTYWLSHKPMKQYELDWISDGYSYLGAREFHQSFDIGLEDKPMGFDCSDIEFDKYQLRNGLLEDVLERYKDLMTTEFVSNIPAVKEVQSNFDLVDWVRGKD